MDIRIFCYTTLSVSLVPRVCTGIVDEGVNEEHTSIVIIFKGNTQVW
jgi:hypothetical protein